MLVGNNDVTQVDTEITYSGTYTSISNYYGEIVSGITTMKYPVFMGQTYAYNYINIGDMYKLAKNLTKAGNPYGLNNNVTDSHQMKNSEWGAVTYLTHSKYGLNGEDVLYLNNVNLNDIVPTVNAVTGYTGQGTDVAENTLSSISDTIGDVLNGISYAWYTTNGQKGSSTQNITGIYDLSGGVSERMASYIENSTGTGNRNAWGGDLILETTMKYKTIYPHNTSNDISGDNWIEYNNKVPKTYGDAILETSTAGNNITAWNGGHTNYSYSAWPFIGRGGDYKINTSASMFLFDATSGNPHKSNGFRAVLCMITK